MDRRFAANYQHFARITPHDTKVARAHAIPFRSYDDDTASLVLAIIGVALTVATVLSMLAAFKIL